MRASRRSGLVVRVVLGAALLAGCRPRGTTDAGAVDAGPEQAATSMRPSHVQYPAGHGSFVDVIADARSAVVSIHATVPVKSGPAAIFPGSGEAASDVAIGTGFLVEAHGVFVLTNDHIAAAAPELRVVLSDGSEVKAAVVGRDPTTDLALLQIDAAHLTTLPLGSSADLDVGEWIVVLGNPFGDEVTASAGVISATGRHGLGSALGGSSSLYRTYLQTDARIHRGNTGGPVLDTAGQVVGVAVATGDRPGEVSFAIPIDVVKTHLESLRDYGVVARAYLGARVNAVPPDLGQALPERGGAIITEVDRDTPAARAGLRVGDIILKWDGHPVDERTLPTLVTTAVVSKKITITIFRDNATLDLPITPERVPS
jgi:serine protease Do